MRKRNHIQSLKSVGTTGLGLFLIVGLSGCDSKPRVDCKKYPNDNDCRQHTSGGAVFIPNSSYYGTSTSDSHNTTSTTSTTTTSPAKSTGFFSSLSGSSGHSSFGG